MAKLKVRDLMTSEVITLREEENLLIADDLMRMVRIRHLPVVSEGKPVGLVSHRDMLRASVSSIAELSQSEESALKRSIPVQEVMQRDVLTVREDDDALVACELILSRKIGCLPVVNQEGYLVGIVTEADFVELARRYLEENA